MFAVDIFLITSGMHQLRRIFLSSFLLDMNPRVKCMLAERWEGGLLCALRFYVCVCV